MLAPPATPEGASRTALEHAGERTAEQLWDAVSRRLRETLNETTHATWFAAAGGFFYRVHLTERAALRIGFSALIPLHTEVFSVAGAGEAFETPPVAALFELGPELTIW